MGIVGKLLGGVFCLGFGTGALLFMGESQVLACERTNPPTNEGQCELKGVISAGTFSIDALQGAEVKTSAGGPSGGTASLIINTTEQDRTLAQGYKKGANQYRVTAQEIETFIATPTQTKLLIEYGNRTKSYFIGGFFYLAGVIIIFGKSPNAEA